MRPRTPKQLFSAALCFVFLGVPAQASEKRFDLHADQTLVDTGLMQHLVPRFSMKTNTRITLVPAPDASGARLIPDGDGIAVIASEDTTWFLTVPDGDAHAARFADWLTSDVGKRTISSFQKDGMPSFTPPVKKVAAAPVIDMDRDTTEGISLSLEHCGRCHVIGPQNKQNGIGSTPSFALLRGFGDWQERFETFYVLNPHPAFTQIDEVTAPFDIERPSPIHPVEMTLEDLDEILAYVATISPANLGAPIKHQ